MAYRWACKVNNRNYSSPPPIIFHTRLMYSTQITPYIRPLILLSYKPTPTVCPKNYYSNIYNNALFLLNRSIFMVCRQWTNLTSLFFLSESSVMTPLLVTT